MSSTHFTCYGTQVPQGGERISYQAMIQWIWGWGRLRLGSVSPLLGASPSGQRISMSLSMLNPEFHGFLTWFRHLQQCLYVRLLVWWFSRREINLQSNAGMMEATGFRLISASASAPSCLDVQSNGLYSLVHWRCRQTEFSGTVPTQRTWIHSICSRYNLFDLMLQVIGAATYRNLMCLLWVSL